MAKGLFAIAYLILSANFASAAQLNYGKYFGAIQMDGRTEVIATSVDAFVTQIDDPTAYPALNIILRVNLGGYVSSEYVGYHFVSPKFDYEKSVLQLDDAKNELSATLQVTNTDTQTILEGAILYRPTNSKGKIRVTIDQGAMLRPELDADPVFLSVLNGEYLGKCGKRQADLQIETGRGLGDKTPGNELAGYTITGRMGFTDAPLCKQGKGGLNYCSQYALSTGIYYLFSNRLRMQGALGMLDCSRDQDSLQCTLQGQNGKETCQLTKKPAASTGPMQISAGNSLEVPSDQKNPLPDPLPPGNEELIAALNGDFYGFIHFENQDIYQLLQMSVVASTFTDNMHVQNQVQVEPTVLLRLGSSWDSSPVSTSLFPQRVFHLNQGFAFQSPENDSILVIEDWRQGYVSGVMYSRAFGRVGTFEMQKGTPPSIPRKMSVVPNTVGEFLGPSDAPAALKNIWSLEIEAPNESAGSHEESIPLLGRFQLQTAMGSARMFDAISLDLNAGALRFLIKEKTGDRLVTGQLLADDKIKLLWPAGPLLSAPMDYYNVYTYLLVK